MQKGGYQILDFKDIELTQGEANYKFPDFFNILKGTRKTVLVSGVNFEGVELRDQFAQVDESVPQSVRVAIRKNNGAVLNIIINSDGVVVAE